MNSTNIKILSEEVQSLKKILLNVQAALEQNPLTIDLTEEESADE